jgi:thiol-disulfide isomerase/thioredoxin
MKRRVFALGAAALALLLAACAGETAPTASPAPSEAAAPAASPPPTADGGVSGQPSPAAPAPASSSATDATFDFPTGPAVLVPIDYEPPTDRVDSTGAHLPVNGKPTVVLVDAIWCPTCALTRPIFHRVRVEYQDDINLVVLDFDRGDDAALARKLGAWAHPAWAVVAPDSDEVTERRFGPLNERGLRAFLDGVRADHPADHAGGG